MSDPRVRDALAASIDGHTSTEIPGFPSGCSNSQMTDFVSLALTPMLLAAGCSDLRTLGQEVCGLKRFNFTTALVVGLDAAGYQRRYCYEHSADARAALLRWNGEGHPDGPWIKCKGAGIDLLNPAWR